METTFIDVHSAGDPRWPKLNEVALLHAYAIAERDRDAWFLLTCWRADVPSEDNWGHHAWISNQLPPGTIVETLVAHYRVAPRSRTRFEPWMFAARDVKRSLVESMLQRLGQDLAFWSDGTLVHVMTREGTRCLGEFRPGAIAHAICESSIERARFLGFDLPMPTCVEALARSAYVGAVSD